MLAWLAVWVSSLQLQTFPERRICECKELEWARTYLVVNYGCLSQKSLPTMQVFTWLCQRRLCLVPTYHKLRLYIHKYPANSLDFPWIKVGAKIHRVPTLPVLTNFARWFQSYLWFFSLPHLVLFSSCSSSALLCCCVESRATTFYLWRNLWAAW